MQTLIYKKPLFNFFPHLSPFHFVSSSSIRNHNFLQIHAPSCNHTSNTLSLCSATSSHSLSCNGWDDFQLNTDSVRSGESNELYNLLNSLGIGDKKYVFVYLFGFVCALAVSRVKVSSIVVFPACAVLFAVGFSIGLVKGGHMKEVKLNGEKRKVVDETLRGSIEKLRNLGDNLNVYNAKVLNLKNDVRRGIESNQVTVCDLEGYVDVIESADESFRNIMDAVESCLDSIPSVNQAREVHSDQESSRRKKKSGEMGLDFSHYFKGLFGDKFDSSRPGKIKDSAAGEQILDVNNPKEANILASSIKGKDSNSTENSNEENKWVGTLRNPFDRPVRTQNTVANFVNGVEMENTAIENEKRNVAEECDTDELHYDQTMYTYQDNVSRFVNRQQVNRKEYQDEIETLESQNSSFDSMGFSISMNHTMTAASYHHRQKNETQDKIYSRYRYTEEDKAESQMYSNKKEMFTPEKQSSFARKESENGNSGSSPSSVLGDDLEFNRYLTEANDLLKQAKKSLKQKVVDGRAEHALHKSAMLLSRAIGMRPTSLLAVGQLGNTYLLHGELKLRISRELRSVLARNDSSSVEDLQKLLDRFDDQLANHGQITSVLADVCEECEELLIKAGRKYKLALSIDGNDMRALYNWGLALSFRAQLIADIGPSAARDADKVFLAAIDKFDAMMSKSNAHAPNALFRWGAALQHRSRLRPRNSREKVKLLQQARRLYEDALHMDSGNLQLQEALSSCDSELDYWYP